MDILESFKCPGLSDSYVCCVYHFVLNNIILLLNLLLLTPMHPIFLKYEYIINP